MNCPYEETVAEIDVLKSRFIGVLLPLDDVNGIEMGLSAVKARYPGARHYPYALRLLPLERCTDDGEPPRSAGLPLLETLRGKGFDRSLLMVCRYFGGTKLGAGRLARTFREIAALTLDKADLAIVEEGELARISLPYASFDALKAEAERLGLAISDVLFAEKVSLSLRGDAKIIDGLLSRFLPTIAIKERQPVLIKRRMPK